MQKLVKLLSKHCYLNNIFLSFMFANKNFARNKIRGIEMGEAEMKDLLRRMQLMEKEIELAQEATEFFLEEEHFDEEKAKKFENEADEIYEKLYMVFDLAAEKIVGITSGRIDKIMAMTMIRCRRSEVERLFA